MPIAVQVPACHTSLRDKTENSQRQGKEEDKMKREVGDVRVLKSRRGKWRGGEQMSLWLQLFHWSYRYLNENANNLIKERKRAEREWERDIRRKQGWRLKEQADLGLWHRKDKAERRGKMERYGRKRGVNRGIAEREIIKWQMDEVKKPLQTPLWVECGREGVLSNLELVVVQQVELSYTSIVALAAMPGWTSA